MRIKYRNKAPQTEGDTVTSDEVQTIGKDSQQRSELDSFVEALAPSSSGSGLTKNTESSTAQQIPQRARPGDSDPSVGGSKSASSSGDSGSSSTKAKRRSRKGRFQVQDSAFPIKAAPGRSTSIPQNDIHSVSEGIEGLRVADTETVNSKSDVIMEDKEHEEVHEDDNFIPEIPARVIYIDDDPINRNILKKKLSKGDSCTVELANNGEAGAEAVINDEQGFDVVLMDLMMPIKDGYNSCESIRQAEKAGKVKGRNWHRINKRIPIFAVSASISPNHHDALIECGFDGELIADGYVGLN